ncbi:MAG: nucleotidyltransferase family protein [Ignavibacteria bacterium]|nr:nucleotidyltransferase family protein [Ignavibacteria bacterium]
MTLNREYILEFLRKNREYHKQTFEVTSISLFGSFARGEETEDSDIDLLVEMPPDLHNLVGVIDYLEKAFERKVDIIRNRPNLSTRFAKHVLREKINA